MRIRFRGGAKFQKADFAESSEKLYNPGRGWYHVYTIKAQPSPGHRSVEEEVWLDEACREEELALVLIDIGAFRVSGISAEALSHIGQVLEFFHQNKKRLLLRFVYDTEGKGMSREPLTLSMVKKHMEQAGSVLQNYLEDILVLQGIFVGNWGEMHGSKFLDEESMCSLVNTLYRVTEGKCFLAVRTPAQWRRIAGSSRTVPGVEERLALFNDGIFGSFTDLGTYGTESRAKAGENGSWSRREELEWQDSHMGFAPNGGEVLSGETFTGYLQAVKEMEQMHLCYLNRIYHPDQLEYWKGEQVRENGCWAGVSGYDYIGLHLGYRFTVRDVTMKKGRELQIYIENCGFGNLCEEAECFLVVEGKDKKISFQRLDTDPREWKSGQETILSAAPGCLKEADAEAGRLWLLLKRKSDGRVIRFANQGTEDRVPLGEFIDC